MRHTATPLDSAHAPPSGRSRGLVQHVVDGLTASFVEGTLAPGTKLPTEAEIMSQFGVSRTVIREAISRLQANSLVETRHGIGTFALMVPKPAPPKVPPGAEKLVWLNALNDSPRTGR